MKKIYVLMMLLGTLVSKAQVTVPADSGKVGTTGKDVYKPAIPITQDDSLANAQEYNRDVWKTTWGLKGGLSQGKYKITEGQVIRVSSSGTPLLVDGKVVRDNLVINGDLSTGFNGGLFARFTRGFFYLQPEVNYAYKAGKFDILSGNGDLVKRVEGKFSSIDVPLLLGLRFRKTRIFAGPVANFGMKLDSKLKGGFSSYYADDLDEKFFDGPKFNFQAGIGFEFGKFLVDLRYERGLSSYTSIQLGPSNSPLNFQLFADSFNFSIGYIH